MKVAKADKEEWEKVMRWVHALDEELKYPEKSDDEFGAWVRTTAPCLFRVVFGYQILVDNACDPDADTLEFKPEIVKAMDAYEAIDAAKTELKRAIAILIDDAFTAGFDADNAGVLGHYDGFARAEAAIEECFDTKGIP